MKKLAIITGHTGGIGRILTTALSSDYEIHGFSPSYSGTDVSRWPSVSDEVENVTEDGRSIDLLINAAAIHGSVGKFLETDHGLWWNAIKTNVRGTANMIRACALYMRHGGSIINFAGAGVGGPNTAWAVSAMAASKAAIVELTEVLAKDPSFAKIRINAISPGSVPTPGVKQLLRGGPGRLGADFYAQTAKEYAEGDPSASKVVELVRWLISDAASGVTGRCISATRDDYKSVKDWSDPNLFRLRRIT
jgi:meso-butanediol dehydrogenase / (S,S)-butanediol dehydrogenase / diacetyl reductase